MGIDISSINSGGSGLDINGLVDQLIEAESQTLYKKKERKEIIGLKKKEWMEMNTALLDFQKTMTKFKDSVSEDYKALLISDTDVLTAKAQDGAINASYDINVTQLADNMVVASDKLGGAVGIDGTFNISDGSTSSDISISSIDTIDDVITKVNESGIEVTATKVDGRLVLSHNKTGSSNVMSFTDTDNILESVGILDATKAIKTTTSSAKNSIAEINGLVVSRPTNEFNDVIENVEFSVDETGSSSIKIDDDTNKLVNDVKNIINAYNELNSLLDDRLTEDAVENPVTDYQKRQGMLRGEAQLKSIKNGLRSFFSTNMGGEFNYMFNIGIETTNAKGDIELVDEDKLKEAFLSNKASIKDMFFKDIDGDGEISEGDGGMVAFMGNMLDPVVTEKENDGSVIRSILDGLDSRSKRYDYDIEREERSIESKREYYQRQFLAMEKAVTTFKSQGNMLEERLKSINYGNND